MFKIVSENDDLSCLMLEVGPSKEIFFFMWSIRLSNITNFLFSYLRILENSGSYYDS